MIDDPVLLNDWHPVSRSDKLPEGGVLPVRLLGEDLVLWRSGGQALAFQDLCIHRGSRLSLGKVRGGRLACAYHGWEYAPSGQCARIPAHPEQQPPAKAQAVTYRLQERYGLVWVSLGQPAHDLPDLPEARNPANRTALAGPAGPVKASGPRLVENFLDVAHFPYVHAGTLGDESRPEIADYAVETGLQGVVASGIRVYQPDPYGTGQGDYIEYTYKAFRPLLAYLRKETERGDFLSILLAITPIDERTSTAYFFLVQTDSPTLTEESMVQFQYGIFAEDQAILESQRPELLPLDLHAELHLRCDKTAVAYRRWLKELGLKYGAF